MTTTPKSNTPNSSNKAPLLPLPTTAASEQSRDRSNPAPSSKKVAVKPPPANNKFISDFFTAATATTQQQQHSKKPKATAADDSTTMTTTTGTPTPTTSLDSTATLELLQKKMAKLEQQLQDKDEQLKAVTNNRTILHISLESALKQTKTQLVDLQEKATEKSKSYQKVLEDLLRTRATQQAQEMRETLATDGARLGRIVYARAGMGMQLHMRAMSSSVVESWEEGHATKGLETRKKELKVKRAALEQRAQALQIPTTTEQDDKENTAVTATATITTSELERVEAREAVRMHLNNVRRKENELAEEEQALNDAKGAHIRALKLVASEDASRFRSRPKVRTILYTLLASCFFLPCDVEMAACQLTRTLFVNYFLNSCTTATFYTASWERVAFQKSGEDTT
jgi:hypothetical protein